MRHLSLLCLLLSACAENPEGAPDEATDAGVPITDAGDAPVMNPYGDFEGCPELRTGPVYFDALGEERRVIVELPEEPEGAPVILVWHWLGGTPNQILDVMNLRRLADEGYIVMAPESTGQTFEWDYSSIESSENLDLALIDTMLGCAFDEHGIDTTRVYATGMSAGGLMSSYLTMIRAELFAAVAPFSGGMSEENYVSPAQTIPVLLTWGGPSDTYGEYSFEEASLSFAALLEADGNPVYPCVHAGGHVPPVEASVMVERFFADHQLGEPSPWLEAVPPELPAFCER